MSTLQAMRRLLMLMWVVLLGAWYWQASMGLDVRPATTHAQFTTLFVSGDQARLDRELTVFGGTLILLLILFFGVAFRLGCGPQWDDHGGLRWAVRLSTAVLIAVALPFVAVFYKDATAANEVLWGPFPRATSWMLLAFVIAPLGFTLTYVCGYGRWFSSDATATEAQGWMKGGD